MRSANTRNKAMRYEAIIRSGIAEKGVGNVAAEYGVDISQISRMQSGRNCFVERAAKLLAVIGFMEGEETVIIKGEETAALAKALISMLEHVKSEAPTAGTVEASGAIKS